MCRPFRLTETVVWLRPVGRRHRGSALASTFTWLDYSEREQRLVRDVLGQFRDQETVDELGVGVIRDGFADLLFPGTTTVMTRARYFLMVPWVYRRLEANRIAAARFPSRLREDELRLMRALLRDADDEGVIGRVAGDRLQRLPSNIYWLGLGAWGIRTFPGNQADYVRTLGSFYASVQQTLAAREEGSEECGTRHNWHGGLPPAPAGFPDEASIRLRRIDAEYLSERIASARARTGEESLLAFLVRVGEPADVEHLWEHPALAQAPPHILRWVRHVWAFAETMHGAALLYNLMLAQLDGREERIADYEDRLQLWCDAVDGRQADLDAWDRRDFWRLVGATDARVRERTRTFVDDWLSIALTPARRASVAQDQAARDLIEARERALKRGRARLHNRRALENWSGWSGASQMTYRWGVVSRILADIQDGMAADA